MPRLALLVCALLLLVLPAHAQTLRAERPTYAVGDQWIRSDGVFSLVGVEADHYVYQFAAGQNMTEIHMSRDLSLMRVLRNAPSCSRSTRRCRSRGRSRSAREGRAPR